jgi:hypothetical protein
MTTQPSPRWGVRFTADPTHNLQYVQDLYDNDASAAKRGELFVNEPLNQLYYVGGDGVAKRIGSDDVVPFAQIDFTGIREFADDAAAAAATPPLAVGGLYRTGSILKIRVS